MGFDSDERRDAIKKEKKEHKKDKKKKDKEREEGDDNDREQTEKEEKVREHCRNKSKPRTHSLKLLQSSSCEIPAFKGTYPLQAVVFMPVL